MSQIVQLVREGLVASPICRSGIRTMARGPSLLIRRGCTTNTFTEKSTRTNHRFHVFLSRRLHYCNLHFAALNKENGVGLIALGENLFTFLGIQYALAL